MTKKPVIFFAVGFAVVLVLFMAKSPLALLHSVPTTQAINHTMVAPAVVDAINDIIRIPSLQSGTIKTMDVTVGQFVKKGQILFSLKNELAQNNVRIQKIMLVQAKNQLQLEKKKIHHDELQLARLRSIDKRSISKSLLQDQIYVVNLDKVQLKQAHRQVVLAQANLKQAEMNLQQYTMLSPKDGIVLQINAHLDEFVGASQPVMMLGDRDKVMVRVTLDERDMQKFNPKAKAYLTYYNDKKIRIPLYFLQLNQYVVTQERSNFSRVQEVIYYFNRQDYPQVVAGQQLDAHIPVKKEA